MSSRPSSSSIREFCERHGIHQSTYYRRRADMPRAIRIGGQLRITEADEAEWIRRKQVATDATGRAA